MIIDAHTHIFPPTLIQNRGALCRDEDAFAVLYQDPKSKMVTAENLIQMMNEQGVDRAVVFGFPWQDENRFRTNNDYIINAVQKYPDQLIGLACFDLFHPNAGHETERCLDSGLKGVGELACYQSGLSEIALTHLEPIMEQCRTRDLPVLIHVNESIGHQYPGKAPITLEEIWRLILRFPDNKLILAHWGAGIFFFAAMKKQVKAALTNVWLDTAASPYLYDPIVYDIAKQTISLEKVLFGSDFPLLLPSRYKKEFSSTCLSSDEQKAVLGNNAASLFGIN
ncbi:amidohydrolase family protein [Desulfobacterales bacterium HSG17]|nr:amidohydrolase family protein [Desulfobacterales bacterium HSG17]